MAKSKHVGPDPDLFVLPRLRDALYEKVSVEMRGSRVGGHDFSHVFRVLGYLRRLSAYSVLPEKTRLVLDCAVLAHDLGYVRCFVPGRHCAAGARILEDFLAEGGFELSGETRGKLFSLVKRHSPVVAPEPGSIEEQLVRDADMLDVFGAVGVVRGFLNSAALGLDFDSAADRLVSRRLGGSGFSSPYASLGFQDARLLASFKNEITVDFFSRLDRREASTVEAARVLFSAAKNGFVFDDFLSRREELENAASGNGVLRGLLDALRRELD